MPTIGREALNRHEDIMREFGVVRTSRQPRRHLSFGPRVSQCDGKFAHETYAAAKEVAQRPGRNINTYRCPHCRKWHVGSQILR